MLGISIVSGLIFYAVLFGLGTLKFSAVDWIYINQKDLLLNQLGWEWFRQTPWSYPVGFLSEFGFPTGSYASMSDPILLLGIPFKLFSEHLNDSFQYLGLWQLISLIGQLFCGMLIFREFTSSFFARFLGASLLVLSPPFLFRFFYHVSLTAQWVILLGIWFVLLERKRKLWRGGWFILIALTTMIHMYLVVMVVALWLLGAFLRLSGKEALGRLFLEALSIIATVAFIDYSMGLFALRLGALSSNELGDFSWNLNGFINSQNYSSVFSDLGLRNFKQYEGFSYLGLGNLLLVPIATVLYFKAQKFGPQLEKLLPFLFFSIGLAIIALSQKAFFGVYTLWNIDLPEKIHALYSVFQSTGRFIWPVFYLIVIFGVSQVVKKFRFSSALLVVVLALQFFDIYPLLQAKKINTEAVYESPLKTELWQDAASAHERIMLLPARNPVGIYEPFAIYTSKARIPLNLVYVSRVDSDAVFLYGENTLRNLVNEESDSGTLYVFWDESYETNLVASLQNTMIVCKVDGYTVGLSTSNPIASKALAENEVCSIPKK